MEEECFFIILKLHNSITLSDLGSILEDDNKKTVREVNKAPLILLYFAFKVLDFISRFDLIFFLEILKGKEIIYYFGSFLFLQSVRIWAKTQPHNSRKPYSKIFMKT